MPAVPSHYYLFLSAILFTIGAFGVLIAEEPHRHLPLRGADAERGEPHVHHLRHALGLDGQIFAFL